jgi:putative membrane protein
MIENTETPSPDNAEKSGLITRDYLAIERTRLANERTFLAYFRTFIVLLSSGIAVMRLEMLKEIQALGFFLVALSPIVLAVGWFRLVYVRRKIRTYYKDAQ